MAILSFHATKVFHTFEGGAVVSASAGMTRRIDQLRDFGFASETEVLEIGINARMNEFQAAFGLLHLRHLHAAIDDRRRVRAYYRAALAGIEGLRCLAPPAVEQDNHGYFPVRVDERFAGGRDASTSGCERPACWRGVTSFR